MNLRPSFETNKMSLFWKIIQYFKVNSVVRSSLVDIFREKSDKVASTHKSSTRQRNHIFNLLLLLSRLACPVLLLYSSFDYTFLYKVCIWQHGTHLSEVWKEITVIGSPACMWESGWEHNKFTYAITSLKKKSEFQLQWPCGHKDHKLQDRRRGKERAAVRQVYIVTVHPAVVIYPKLVLLRQKSGFLSCCSIVYKIKLTLIHTVVQQQ